MKKDVAQGALFGLIGVILGIFISLLPTQLIKEQDKYEKARNRCLAIEFEIRENLVNCVDIGKTLRDLSNLSNKIPPKTLISSSLNSFIWKSSIADGEFLSVMPENHILQIDQTYDEAETLNEILRHYSFFTALDRGQNDYRSKITTYHFQIDAFSKSIATKYSNILRYLPEDRHMLEDKATKYELRIKRLYTISTVLIILLCLKFLCN
jgi:hypothetical protein